MIKIQGTSIEINAILPAFTGQAALYVIK